MASASYTKSFLPEATNTPVWHNVPRTLYTLRKRKAIQAQLDNFTSFSWRGVDAWETFGAFIINEKNSLKFFNGPTWSNKYSSPQFSSNVGQLTGMDFKIPSLSFTIGIYWFSEEEYRYLLDWLNPYEINELSFGFEDRYFYQVKLSAISEGTRYILGREPVQWTNLPDLTNLSNNINLVGGDSISQYRYYTEIKLTFELQGPQCAYKKDLVQWNWEEKQEEGQEKIIASNNYSYTSDLDFPIEANFNFVLDKTADSNPTTNIRCDIRYNNQSFTLFNIDFINLPYNTKMNLNFKYTSEDGLLYWQQEDEKYHLLSSLSTLTTGSHFVQSISSKIFNIPGRFNTLFQANANQFTFELICSDNISFNTGISNIIGRGRTNTI